MRAGRLVCPGSGNTGTRRQTMRTRNLSWGKPEPRQRRGTCRPGGDPGGCPPRAFSSLLCDSRTPVCHLFSSDFSTPFKHQLPALSPHPLLRISYFYPPPPHRPILSLFHITYSYPASSRKHFHFWPRLCTFSESFLVAVWTLGRQFVVVKTSVLRLTCLRLTC